MNRKKLCCILGPYIKIKLAYPRKGPRRQGTYSRKLCRNCFQNLPSFLLDKRTQVYVDYL